MPRFRRGGGENGRDLRGDLNPGRLRGTVDGWDEAKAPSGDPNLRQVNGMLRATFEAPRGSSEDALKTAALALPAVLKQPILSAPDDQNRRCGARRRGAH